MIEYINTRLPDQKGKSILTLSHELNYLLAYHTDFDLLLPEGFPLNKPDAVRRGRVRRWAPPNKL